MFRISLLGFILFISTFCFSQENYIPSKDNIEARKWFQDSKFGLFIHWGIYKEFIFYSATFLPPGENYFIQSPFSSFFYKISS